MWVTIIGDASFCPDTKKAGYAFWISSQRGKKGGEGVIKGDVEDNTASEMMVLLNALHVAKNREVVIKGDNVLLQTDCLGAIHAFTEAKNLNGQKSELTQWLNNFKRENDLYIRFKHVKGHSKKQESRYIVNNICDRKARKNLRKARAKHEVNEIKNYLHQKTIGEKQT